MKPKIIDLYIIKKFLGTFFFSLLLILAITIIFDFSEKIDDFIEEEVPLNEIVFDYYLNWIPYFANLFSSLFIFITVIFFTSKMATHTEIVAILSNGVSFRRMLRPYIISSLFIAILSFFMGTYIIPPANKTRIEFDNKYLRNPYRDVSGNIHKQVRPGIFIYIQHYSAFSDVGHKFTMEHFEDGKLKSKLTADFVKWDTTKNKWNIRRYYIRNINGMEEEIVRGDRTDTTLNVKPEDFKSRLDFVEAMNLTELNKYIEKVKMQGTENIVSYQFDKHSRFSYPFSIIILTIIGFSLSSRKTRGGIGMHIGLGILLSFTYILFMRFSEMFAIGGLIPAVAAVWIPNTLYGIIAFILFRQAPK